MRPFTVKTHISADRERVFDFLTDLANRPAFCDHFMEDFRLARAKTDGVGAAARFKLDPPLVPKTYVETAIAEAERPRLAVEEGRYMRWGRSAVLMVWEVVPETRGVVRVELTVETQPGTRWDAFKESFGMRGWLRRKFTKSLERLRALFEEGAGEEVPRATVAGYEPVKAPRFGGHLPAPRVRQGSG